MKTAGRTVIALLAAVTMAPAQRTPAALSPVEWLQDLAALERGLTDKHQDLFHTVSREEFTAAAISLRTRIPTLASGAVAVELARLVAMVKDGHTELQLLQPALGFERLPVSFYRYEEGLFITAIDPAEQSAAGSQVLRIGTLATDEAIARVAPLLSGDTPMEIPYSAPAYLTSPQILFPLGVIAAPHAVPLEVLTRAGERRTLTLRPSAAVPALTSMRVAAGVPDPLSASRPGSYYWFTAVPSSRLLYFQLNASRDQDGTAPLSEVTREFFRRVDRDKPQALVLDVRNNNGGNVERNREWIKGIADRPEYQADGRLFVIVGRRTFSAGLDIVTALQAIARVTTVGEPPRGLPAGPGNRETFVLPNSRIVVDYSERIDSRAFRGAKVPLKIGIAAPPRFDAAIAGRDVAIEAIQRAIR